MPSTRRRRPSLPPGWRLPTQPPRAETQETQPPGRAERRIDSPCSRRSVRPGAQVRREVDDAAQPGERLAPALERLGVGVEDARDAQVEGPVGEGQARPVAGGLQAHRDRGLPRLVPAPRPAALEAAAALPT